MDTQDELPEVRPNPEATVSPDGFAPAPAPVTAPEPAETRFLKWVVFGSRGVRVGWSVALFLLLTTIFTIILGTATSTVVHKVLHIKTTGEFTAASTIIGELVQFFAILGAAAICARIERRRLLDYNLTGPRPSATS